MEGAIALLNDQPTTSLLDGIEKELCESSLFLAFGVQRSEISHNLKSYRRIWSP